MSSLVAFMMLIMIGEKLFHQAYPPSAEAVESTDLYFSHLETLSDQAFLLLGFIWSASAVIASVILGRLSGKAWKLNAIIGGVLGALLVSVNLIMLPHHPVWFNIVSPIAVFCSFYFGAGMLGGKDTQPPQVR
jgi:hypothetical protein